MTIKQDVEDLSPAEMNVVFQELEAWDRDGYIGNSITRRILEKYSSPQGNNFYNSFFENSIAFQVEFYRMLARKYMNQRVL